MGYLEGYEASCCIVSLNVIIITPNIIFIEMEMTMKRDWLNRSRILAAFITFIET
jgi:hypothetical protein